MTELANPPVVSGLLPGFSVIMAVQNGARTIEESLESVAAQTYPPHEVIIVDDGSTDESGGIAEAALGRLGLAGRVITLDRAVGAGAARNMAISKCSGCFLAILDADDRWTPGHLLAAAMSFENYPDIVGYCARVEIRHGDEWHLPGQIAPQDPGYVPDGLVDVYRSMINGLNVWNVTLCARKSACQSAGGFSESLHCYEDLWMILNVARQGPFYMDNAIGCVVRIRSQSLSSNRSRNGAATMSRFMFYDRLAIVNCMKRDERFTARDIRDSERSCELFIAYSIRDAARARNWRLVARIFSAVTASFFLQPAFVLRLLLVSGTKTSISGVSLLARKTGRWLWAFLRRDRSCG